MGLMEKAEAPEREAALAKKLSHPNVVKVLEVGEDQDGRRQYMVMEYIDGKTCSTPSGL